MDLGFGKENQTVGDAVNRVLLESSKAQEAAIDSELQRFDALLEDEDALEQLRRRRLRQLQQEHEQNQTWKANGHGTYVELNESMQNNNVAKLFLKRTKLSERVVVHFHRPSTPTCDVFHAHLETTGSVYIWKRNFAKSMWKLVRKESMERRISWKSWELSSCPHWY